MNENKSTIDELFEGGRAMDEALRKPTRDARRLHKALGNPMASRQNGRVVWIRDINIDDDSDPRDLTE